MDIFSLGLSLPLLINPQFNVASYELPPPPSVGQPVTHPYPLVVAVVPEINDPCLTWDRQRLDFVSGCRSLFDTYISKR